MAALRLTFPGMPYFSLHADVRSLPAQRHDHDHVFPLRQQAIHQLVFILGGLLCQQLTLGLVGKEEIHAVEHRIGEEELL